VSACRLRKITSTSTLETLEFPHFTFSTYETTQLFFLKQWLENVIVLNLNFTHLLPDNFTEREVYNLYVEAMKYGKESTLSKTSFLRIWTKYSPHVKIPQKQEWVFVKFVLS